MTYEEANELLDYNPKTGALTWKNRMGRWGRIPAGSLATATDSKGYLYVHIGPKNYRAHRVAWLLHYKEWPSKDLDHINRNRTDNRITNLREATRSEQLQNQKKRSDNTTGVTGVSMTINGTYATSVWVKGKKHYVGTFKTMEEAVRKYTEKKRELHSFFRDENVDA